MASVDDSVDLPADLVAIAVDTNSMPKGRLDIAKIEQLALAIEEQEYDIMIWVPEPVLWEWAEHTFSDLRAARTPYRRAVSAARRAGLSSLPESLVDDIEDADEVVDVIDNAVSSIEGVQILRLRDYPMAAALGLRDQVLLTGAGKRKGGEGRDGVKTGAADSAGVRMILESAGSDGARIVIVSADRDVLRQVVGASAPLPLIIPDLHQVTKALLALASGTDLAKAEIEVAAIRALEDLRHEDLEATTLEVRRHPPFAEVRPEEDYFDIQYHLASIREPEVVDIEVSRRNGYGTVDASALVDLGITAARYNEYAEQVDHDFFELSDVPALVQLSASRAAGWDVSVDLILIQ